MSDTTPTPPATPPSPGTPPSPDGGLPTKPFQGTGSWSNFEKWLGPEGFAQFQRNLCQGIVQQIGHDKEQEQKAARELRKSETGEDD